MWLNVIVLVKRRLNIFVSREKFSDSNEAGRGESPLLHLVHTVCMRYLLTIIVYRFSPIGVCSNICEKCQVFHSL